MVSVKRKMINVNEWRKILIEILSELGIREMKKRLNFLQVDA